MKKLLATLLIGTTMAITTGCNSSWVTEANNIIKVVLPAAINILNLVAVFTGKATNPNETQTITNDVNTVEQLLTDYSNASASAKPGVETQLNAALLTTQTDLQTILGAAHVKDPQKQAEVTALVNFVLSEVVAVESLLPASVPSTSATRPLLTAKQFKKGYNTIMPEQKFKL